MNLRPPRNVPGILGMAMAGAAAVAFLFLSLVELGRGPSDPYTGLIHFLVLPVIGIIGVVLFIIGRRIAERARARGESAATTTLVDLTGTAGRQTALLLTGGIGAIAVFAMAVGGVQAIEYTESEGFCGEICHEVMGPEYVAWQYSPHAQIACVDCHVGSGAASWIQAKLSGINQVISVATDRYPRPIPTPIHNIRSTEVTCEGCHWPSRNLGSVHLNHAYYLTEGFDEPWKIDMEIKVGGGTEEVGFSSGAHWHMNLNAITEYIALDDKRQEIAWVRFTDADGNVTEYLNEETDFDRTLLQTDEPRRVDCLTCHNRPAHRFRTPVDALNQEFLVGNLDPDVPGIRWLGLEVLAADYETSEEGLAAVAAALREGIVDEDEDWAAANPDAVDRTVAVIQRVFSHTRTPEMGIRWLEYPDNSQHWSSPGCFRCHAGNMVSEAGETISSTCNTCHIIRGQGLENDGWQTDPNGLVFMHPADEELMDEPILCHECHDGALGY